MVTELDPGVHSIDIPLPGNPLRNLNSFLIRGSERNLLVDTGFNMEPSLAAMREGLSQLAVDMESTDIFLTHLHSDHIGLAPVIASGKSRIFISGPDREFMRMHMEAGGREELDRYFLSFGFPPKELEENRSKNPAVIYLSKREVEYTEVSDGQVLDLGGRRLECVHTPGHSPGHMCLLDRDNGLLFCGDHIIFTISPNITSWPSVPDSLGNYLASLEMT